jgi:acyl-CoA synthetase (AMP-forming)/AMP-acid ligase II
MDLAGQTTLGEILPIQASRVDLATKPPLYFNGQTYTYAELDAACARTASDLRAHSIREGDSVASCPMPPHWLRTSSAFSGSARQSFH